MHITCTAAEVALRFTDEQQTSYEESELAATVCAFLSGAIERRVVAAITAQDNTATGFNTYLLLVQKSMITYTFVCAAESGDYLVTSGELVFEASAEPIVCTSGIMILQDEVLEHDETFYLLLESSDQGVNLDPVSSQLTIEIRDANSKCRQ